MATHKYTLVPAVVKSDAFATVRKSSVYRLSIEVEVAGRRTKYSKSVAFDLPASGAVALDDIVQALKKDKLIQLVVRVRGSKLCAFFVRVQNVEYKMRRKVKLL